ncbi:hypothetical protein [Actinomadura sediminis]|uniref:DUF4185 domain-containing protein n=1 Tax=Actinomadura sediminis TaxID=1038904 RepID=A0ABW3ERC2_9ACTN
MTRITRTIGAALAAATLLALTLTAGGTHKQRVQLAKLSSLPASQPLGIDPPAGDYYSYAPSVVEQGDTRHVFYCGNAVSGRFGDHVMLSIGARQPDGSWDYGKPRIAFGPTSDLVWANYHTCDPELIRGSFTWGGKTYPWAMFFTAYGCGVQVRPCPEEHIYPNQLGVAFADTIGAGPSGWRIYPQPLIGYGMEFGTCEPRAYCIGQPAVTSIDGAGRLMLFYQGWGGFVWRDVNLADMGAPVIGERRYLPAEGLPDWLHNASLVYDPALDRFWGVYDTGVTNKQPYGVPVQTDTSIVSISASDLWSNTGSWRLEETVTGAHSGFAFNHNAGLARTVYGRPAPGPVLEVVHAVAHARSSGAGGWGEWTYRLWSTTYSLPATQ